jgi:membrane-associated phospholipid phosphatase
MEPLQAWGLTLIAALQSISPTFDRPMQLITALGSSDFFVLFLPLLLWCVNTSLGVRFTYLVLIGDSINSLLKLAFHAPRPYWIDARIRPLAHEASYGIPSGHSQASANVWGYLALTIRRRWAWAAALLMAFLVGFSRVYLGAHFPHDVVAGWLLGTLVLAVYWWSEPRLARWLVQRSRLAHMLAVAVLPAVILLLWGVVTAATASVVDPPEWERQAGLAFPPVASQTTINPGNADNIFTNTGVMFGGGLGLALAYRRWEFDAGGPLQQRVVRFVVGAAVLLALRFGLGAIFPTEPAAVGNALRFVRYAIIGLWVTGLAPAVFLRLGITSPARQNPPR